MNNRDAFLTAIALCEGTEGHPLTTCHGYDVIVTGIDGRPEVFTDFSDHPFAAGRSPKLINDDGLKSSASGRYQFLVTYWRGYRTVLNLLDFGPHAQDVWALQLVRECRALQLADAGRVREAGFLCKSRWASLPGAAYPHQRERSEDFLVSAFEGAGGKLA